MHNEALIANQSSPRILMTGGGTGGHVYPALAIADAIKKLNPMAVVEFAGSRTGIEWRLVPESGYAIHHVTVRGLLRKLTFKNISKNLALPFLVSKGLLEARNLVRHFDADVVVGTGGYVALPSLIAAKQLHRRIAIQEQNAFMGLSNRVSSYFADSIHLAFSEAEPRHRKTCSRMSGNPVRESLQHARRDEALAYFGMPNATRILFMTGGSGGSHAMNEAMATLVRPLLKHKGLGIIWQTGSRYFERYQSKIPVRSSLKMLEYVDRMDLAYAAADLVICRSGASTCAELMLTGKPAILVPSPNVAEDHQRKNAESLLAQGAARVLDEKMMQEELFETVIGLLEDRRALEKMSEAALRLARPDAAKLIAQDVLGLAKTRIR